MTDLTITPQLIEALKIFKSTHPWKGSLEERKEKFKALHAKLNEMYGEDVKLDLDRVNDNADSGSSYVDRDFSVIGIVGRLSVVTFLHEWGHILTRNANQRPTKTWSLELFKQVFPRNYARLNINPSESLVSINPRNALRDEG